MCNTVINRATNGILYIILKKYVLFDFLIAVYICIMTVGFDHSLHLSAQNRDFFSQLYKEDYV